MRAAKCVARYGVSVVALAVLTSGSLGCTTTARLRGQSAEIGDLTTSIEERAYRCAPRELALAKANREFGDYELSQGNFVRAKKHLIESERNARAADLLSDFDECRDQKLAIAVDTTPKAKIVEAKPTPKDKDGDGILDEVDQCPLEPEDFDGFQDEDGCPDLDNDNDGIPDEQDACPDVPEDKDGFQDSDGCPDLDNDLDGILDINDSCPNQAEDFDGFQDEDGCPDPDNDGDGIADLLDQCPGEPETYNGFEDEDGCPDERPVVQMDGDQIKLNEQVFFKFNKSDILPVSYPLLDEVARILAQNPTIHVRIEGHTDSKGKAAYNKKLSNDRAASVRKYLINRGISAERMESVGYGAERPIEDNSTEAGRAANRRVEIHITKR